MMNKDAKMAEAHQFNKEGDCYIHIEMKDGKSCEVLVAGHGLAMLYGLVKAVNRLAEVGNVPFDETLMMMQDLYYAGKEKDYGSK